MNILFMSNHKETLYKVYPPDWLEGRPVMTFPEYKAAPVADVAYIFSTWGMPALSQEEIRACFPRLKAVFYAAGSVQGFARPFLAAGARVFSAWAANAVPVAEFAAAQIVLANKGYFRLHGLYKNDGHRAAVEFAEHFAGNWENSVGLLGAGMIGKNVVALLKPYNLKILVFDPFLSDAKAAELGVAKASLAEIFSTCDVVSNHLANNEQTRGMLDYALFRQMKEYAVFINTGRGAQVDSPGFLRAMAEKPNCTALLDVTDPQEPLPPDSPYFTLNNVILTPHRAGSVGAEVRRMGEYMLAEYDRVTKGEAPLYEVLPAMLETMA